MDFGAIIGVIIGMVLVYSLLSIIVTQVNSLISILLKTRASHLRDGIETLITDRDVQQQILRHPLLNIVTDKKQNGLLRLIATITGRRKTTQMVNEAQMRAQMERVEAGQTPGVITSPHLSGVTWVDPQLFTDALIDTLLNNARDRFYAPLDRAIKPLPEREEKRAIREKISAYKIGGITADELRIDVSCLSVPEVVNALKAAIDQIEPNRVAFEQDLRERDIENVLKGVSQVSDPTTRRALQTILASAQSVEDAERKMTAWFDARMDQVTEAYKRHMQFYTLLIGFIIAMVLNVDSIHLANALYTSPVVRDSVTQIASAFVAQQQTDGTTEAATVGSEDIDVIAAQAASAVNQVANLNLPIGWEYKDAQCNSLIGTTSPTVILSTPTPNPTQTAVASEFPPTADPFATTGDSPLATPPVTELTPLLPIVPDAGALLASVESAEPSPSETGVTQSTIELQPCTDRRNLALYVPFSQSFNLGNLVLKLLGLALTTFAIGQGAPFWFDLLNRVVGRGSNSAPQPVNVTVNNPINGGGNGNGAPRGSNDNPVG